MNSIINAILGVLVTLAIMAILFISAVHAHYMQRSDKDKDETFWQFLKSIL